MVRLAWYDLDRQEDNVVLHRHGLLDFKPARHVLINFCFQHCNLLQFSLPNNIGDAEAADQTRGLSLYLYEYNVTFDPELAYTIDKTALFWMENDK